MACVQPDYVYGVCDCILAEQLADMVMQTDMKY